MEVVHLVINVLSELNQYVESNELGYEIEFDNFHQLIKGAILLVDLFPKFNPKCQSDLDFIRQKVENPSRRISPILPDDDEGKAFKCFSFNS